MVYPARVVVANLALRTLRQLGEHVDSRALMRIPEVHRLMESVAEALVLGVSALAVGILLIEARLYMEW